MTLKMRILPVNILWIWSICDCPVVRVEKAAKGRRLWVSSTVTAMTLTCVKIFQDSGKGKNQMLVLFFFLVKYCDGNMIISGNTMMLNGYNIHVQFHMVPQ